MAEKQTLALRDALRLLGPGPIALISTMYHDQPNMMTAGWLLPLSLDPTYVGVAIQPSRLTHEFITKSEIFAINIPNIDLISAVHLCGMTTGRETDKFTTTKLTPTEAQEIEAPLVAQCVGHIECGVVERITLGDHDLFVGRVLAVSADSEAFDGTWNPEIDAGQLLHHLGGDRYSSLSRIYRYTAEEEQ